MQRKLMGKSAKMRKVYEFDFCSMWILNHLEPTLFSVEWVGFYTQRDAHVGNKYEQAGAELCQAQAQLYLPAEPELI